MRGSSDKSTDLSIVTVVLNDKGGLSTTRESVRRQEGCTIEHIIVDGGSKDGSDDLAAYFESNEAGVTFLPGPDSGIYDGMNRGLARVRGDFVWFLNSGDFFVDPRACSKAVNALREGDAEWMFGAIVPVDFNGKVAGPSLLPAFSIRRLLLGDVHYNHQGLIMRTRFLREMGGFDASLSLAAEYDMYLRSARYHTPLLLREVLTAYRTGGRSTSMRDEVIKEMHLARCKYFGSTRCRSVLNAAITRYQFARLYLPFRNSAAVRLLRVMYLRRRFGLRTQSRRNNFANFA